MISKINIRSELKQGVLLSHETVDYEVGGQKHKILQITLRENGTPRDTYLDDSTHVSYE